MLEKIGMNKTFVPFDNPFSYFSKGLLKNKNSFSLFVYGNVSKFVSIIKTLNFKLNIALSTFIRCRSVGMKFSKDVYVALLNCFLYSQKIFESEPTQLILNDAVENGIDVEEYIIKFNDKKKKDLNKDFTVDVDKVIELFEKDLYIRDNLSPSNKSILAEDFYKLDGSKSWDSGEKFI